MRAHPAAAGARRAGRARTQDRSITDVVQSLAESATLARIVFKRRDDPMMIKAHPEILAVHYWRFALSCGGLSQLNDNDCILMHLQCLRQTLSSSILPLPAPLGESTLRRPNRTIMWAGRQR